ncbi:MAG: hypothetical protein KGL53_14275, partial [Elusimicrobia bacterium]|nr:hypothetical protein [Elusimicrobiota bacterium]
LYPVAVRHRPYELRRGPEEGALLALKELTREGLDGSVLVFMPGLREIRRTMDALGPLCRRLDLELKPLHGSLDVDEQQRVLDPRPRGHRVIVATNVAETGLTIPGVTAVVDSGLHRLAGYSPSREVNTLYLSRVSLANAAQRTGRAGRTAPGRCLRLWSKADELSMPARVAPEVERLELSSLRLQAASLPEPVDWPTPPAKAAWEKAGEALGALKAVDGSDRITPRGRALLRYPLPPRLAAVLEAARGMGPAAFERACAMAAVFETSGERRPDKTADLAELSDDLLAGLREDLPREAFEVFKQLQRLGGDVPEGKEGSLERAWLEAFPNRLAARDGAGRVYKLLDGRGVLLPGSAVPPLILALDIQERAGGGRAKQVTAALYLGMGTKTVDEAFPGECAWTRAAEMDEGQGRVVREERLMFRGLALERREAQARRGDRGAAAELWAERFVTGELRHPGLDEKTEQLVTRIRVARALYPDYGFPELSDDDWRLVYGELCLGKNTLDAIGRVPLAPHIVSYVGRPLVDFLDKALPPTKKLPSGRLGRFKYFEGKPAELSARLGDFIGLTGTLALCEGRLPVLFDILAPNYRTVQKTSDLSSFWKNTYPEVKKELKRRYPKHPWP